MNTFSLSSFLFRLSPFHFVFVCANSSTANSPPWAAGPAVRVLIFTCCSVFKRQLNCGWHSALRARTSASARTSRLVQDGRKMKLLSWTSLTCHIKAQYDECQRRWFVLYAWAGFITFTCGDDKLQMLKVVLWRMWTCVRVFRVCVSLCRKTTDREKETFSFFWGIISILTSCLCKHILGQSEWNWLCGELRVYRTHVNTFDPVKTVLAEKEIYWILRHNADIRELGWLLIGTINCLPDASRAMKWG